MARIVANVQPDRRWLMQTGQRARMIIDVSEYVNIVGGVGGRSERAMQTMRREHQENTLATRQSEDMITGTGTKPKNRPVMQNDVITCFCAAGATSAVVPAGKRRALVPVRYAG